MPQPARSTELGDFLEEIVVSVKKEREAGGEAIHIQSRPGGCFHVSDGIGEGEGDFLNGR